MVERVITSVTKTCNLLRFRFTVVLMFYHHHEIVNPLLSFLFLATGPVTAGGGNPYDLGDIQLDTGALADFKCSPRLQSVVPTRVSRPTPYASGLPGNNFCCTDSRSSDLS